MNRFTSTLALTLAFGLLGSVRVGLADDTSVTTTTKTTTYTGVVSEINPGTSTIILKSATAPAPVTYNYTKETTFVDAQGNVVLGDRPKPASHDRLKTGQSERGARR